MAAPAGLGAGLSGGEAAAQTFDLDFSTAGPQGGLYSGTVVLENLSANGTTARIQAGVQLLGGDSRAGPGFLGESRAWTVVNYADLDNGTTAPEQGAIQLNFGGTLTNQAGAELRSNIGFQAGNSPLASQINTELRNFGAIVGVVAGVNIYGNASIYNAATGEISGLFGGIRVVEGTATVVNRGVIHDDPADGGIANYAVGLNAGGTVENLGAGALLDGRNIGVRINGTVGVANSVTNEGTIQATRYRLGVGVYLDARGALTNDILNIGLTSGQKFGVHLRGSAGTANGVVNGGDIIATYETGVGLFLEANGALSNNLAQIAGSSISGSAIGVHIKGSSGTVNGVLSSGSMLATSSSGIGLYFEANGSTNNSLANAYNGVIAGPAVGVKLNGSGTLDNFGSILAQGGSGTGILLLAGGGLVRNRDTGTIEGTSLGVSLGSGTLDNAGAILGATGVTGNGSLTNSGTIEGTATRGLDFSGGSIVNAVTGRILGVTAGVDISGGGSLNNAGSITGTTRGVSLGGGTLDNSGLISGIVGVNGNGTLRNLGGGRIVGSDDVGVSFLAGGSVTNAAVGSITGKNLGVLLSGGATLLNSGTVSGATGVNGLNIGGLATITNAAGGRILGTTASAVSLLAGGSLVNQSGGTINGRIGVTLGGGATFANAGLLEAEEGVAGSGGVTNQAGGRIVGTVSEAVDLSGGSLSNAFGGTINGKTVGVRLAGGATLANAGDIGGETGVAGGGSLTNAAGGRIVGTAGAGIAFGATNDRVTNAGTITGVGTALDLGGGNDALILDTGAAFGGLLQGGAGVDSGLLRGQGSLASNVAAFETLEVAAGAEWSLFSTAQFSQSSSIEGSLALDGRLESAAVTVESGGRLSGSGVLAGDLALLDGGRLSPGGALATFTVEGDFTFRDGAFLEVELNGAGANDLVKVSGSAGVEGGTLRVSELEPPLASDSATFVIIDTGQGVAGDFTALEEQFIFFDGTTRIEGDDLLLTMARNGTGIGDVGGGGGNGGGTPNNGNVGDAIDDVGGGNGLDDILDDILDDTAAGDVQNALAQLSGDLFAGTPNVRLRVDRGFLEGLLDRSVSFGRGSAAGQRQGRLGQLASAGLGEQQLAAGPLWSGAGRRGVWAEADVVLGEIKDSNAGDTRYSSYAARLGFDVAAGSHWAWGLAGSLDLTEAENTHSAEADLKGAAAAAYARFVGNRVAITASALGSFATLEGMREIRFGDFEATATGETAVLGFGGGLEAGYELVLPGGIELQPSLAVTFNHVEQDPFTEAGAGAADLEVGGGSIESLRSSLGARLYRGLPVGASGTLTPEARLAWRREHLDSALETENRFAAAPAGSGVFTVLGAEAARDLGVFGFGMTYSGSRSVRVYADYELSMGAGQLDHRLAAGLRIGW